MELNYDATVYFLYRKHGGDMEKVLRSFRAFLKFAATLGNEECAQLEHVDEFYYTEEVLRSRVGYWEWKVGEMRRVKKERKQKYEKDTVFGGTAVPSGHNVFKDSLKGRLDEIAAEVRTMLPTIDDSDSDSAGSIPEVFFSGVDWSKTKLPGDEGFHWDSSDNDVDDKADPPSMPPSRTPHQDLAKEVLPPSTLLPPSTITSQLDSLPTETLATQLRSGDMSALKRALNPNRPLRPSQCRYDEDGNPLDGIEPATTDDADDAAMLKEFMEKAKQPDQPSTAPQRGGRWTIIEHSDSSDDDDCHNLKGGKGKGYKGAGGKGSKGACL
eukprot:TRINITY_DN20173_c0_g1_i2.p1 TRINITY_DN20173_c0_g1~~TRINITY_DN20173_c0_g1_i2.p1  ORF type:complete len:326 (+),score=108.72 TRINITY_DN20173_c0_g1_i2:596-1573(+)